MEGRYKSESGSHTRSQLSCLRIGSCAKLRQTITSVESEHLSRKDYYKNSVSNV